MIRAAGRSTTGQPFIIVGLTGDDVLALSRGSSLTFNSAAPIETGGLAIPDGPLVSVMAAADENELGRRLAALGLEALDG